MKNKNHDTIPELTVVSSKGQLIKEDMAILKEVKSAWKDIEKGECKSYSVKDFFRKFEG